MQQTLQAQTAESGQLALDVPPVREPRPRRRPARPQRLSCREAMRRERLLHEAYEAARDRGDQAAAERCHAAWLAAVRDLPVGRRRKATR